MSCATVPRFGSESFQVGSSAQRRRAGGKQKTHRIVRTLSLWQARSQQRRELRDLLHHPELLMDVGLSVYDVRYEGSKPFWRE